MAETINNRRSAMKLILVLAYLIFSILGLILMKKGGNAGSIGFNNGNVGLTVNVISFIGIILYIISFLLYTKVVTSFDLSYISPIITGVSQILILLASWSFLKETISKQGIIGAIIIIIGILVMNIKK